jgi:mycothiol synthase
VRAAHPSDLERIAAIRSACWPAYPQTGADLERNDVAFPQRQRFVFEEACAVVAHAMLEPNESDGTALIELDVQPELQSRGIGTRFYASLQSHLRDFNALTTRLPESHAFALHFAQARGFKEERRTWHQVLRPQAFDPSSFAGLEADLNEQGYTLHAYPEIADERKLYDLYTITSRDVPGATKLPSFDKYKIRVFERPTTRLEAHFIAVKEGDWVAYTATRQRAADRPLEWHTGMTGVLTPHRGRGLAVALKARVIELAQSVGITELHTNNDSTNAAMLSVNRKLGYERESGVIQMKLERAPGSMRL